MKKSFLNKIALILVCLFSPITTVCNNESNQKPVFISLGNRCIPAMFLRNFGLRAAAYPFDWIFTDTFKSGYTILQNDFHNFLLKENLIIHPNHDTWVYDQYTQASFIHDFPWDQKIKRLSDNFLANYSNVKEKYDRRIKRFRSTLNSNHPIIFIRIDDVLEENQENTIRLRDLIHKQYPSLQFHIIQICRHLKNRNPWNIDGISNVYVKAPDLFLFDDEYWKAVINEIEKITGHALDELKEQGQISPKYSDFENSAQSKNH